VDVVSLGFRTDLALLRLGGSEVEDRDDHLVVRTPHNPSYYWGNFLLLAAPPRGSDEAAGCLEQFATAFPDARHVTIGVDGTDGRVEDLAALAGRGLTTEASTVMAATAVHPPPRPDRDADYRALESDDDWAQSVELAMTVEDLDSPAEHRVFATRRASTNRSLTESGHGRWFGAFLAGRLVSQMGLLAAGQGLARFQSVETAPDQRGRGLAGTLVHHVSRFGLDEMGARTLVMVADPDYVAIRVYRSVGFRDAQTQVQAERTPSGEGA
jgi:GNAT superfamily N-acetyltransferase